MTPFGRVDSHIDYDRRGIQLASLRIAQSRNDSAWHAMHIPIAMVNGGPGPTVLLTAGVHGDEFEGPVALLKLLHRLDPDEVRGRMIVVPALNMPAVGAGHRLSPLDDRDLNRSFSGESSSTVTAAIAGYVESTLLPIADVILDIHSGGRSMLFLPCLWITEVPDRDLRTRMIACARAFAAPTTLMTPSMACGAMSDAAERIGKIYLSTEVAGGAMISLAALSVVEAGLQRLLAYLGIVSSEASQEPPPATQFMQIPANGYVDAIATGLLEPRQEVGEMLAPGDPLGCIHSIERPEQQPIVIPCPRPGILVGRRAPAHVRRGDGVAVIAENRLVD